MLAMVTHGRRWPSRWLFGSVAEAVLQAAPVSVLLVRRHEPDGAVFSPIVYTSLLVPLDGSTFSEQALDVARKLARASGAVLHLLTVIDRPAEASTGEDSATSVGTAPGSMPVEVHGGTQWIVGMLQRTAQRLQAEGLQVQTLVEYGKPAEEILRSAAAVDTDLAVMATHGRTALERMWFGSVAAEVIRRLDRPVLLGRPPSRAQREQQLSAWT